MASKAATVQSVLDEINKKHGKGSGVMLGEAESVDIDVISTGSLTLDQKLGIGGWPRGRITEIAGNPSSGKTTLTIHGMVEAQKMGLNVAFIDVEHAFDPEWAERLGLDTDKLLFAQPNSAEEAMDIVLTVVESGQFGMVVLDSVGALACKAEIEGDMGDSHIGLVARLMAQSCRKLASVTSNTNTALIFINQMRDNIGVHGYGPKTVTTGGKSLPFFASVRCTVSRTGSVKEKNEFDEPLGNTVKVKMGKNKLAAPFKVADLELMFDSGFCKVKEAITIGVKSGIIKQGGAWYTYGEQKFNGTKNLRKHFLENEEDFKELVSQITGE